MIKIEFESPIGPDTIREWMVWRDDKMVVSGATSADASEILERYIPNAPPDEPVEIIEEPECRHESRQISRTTVREVMAE